MRSVLVVIFMRTDVLPEFLGTFWKFAGHSDPTEPHDATSSAYDPHLAASAPRPSGGRSAIAMKNRHGGAAHLCVISAFRRTSKDALQRPPLIIIQCSPFYRGTAPKEWNVTDKRPDCESQIVYCRAVRLIASQRQPARRTMAIADRMR